MASELTVQTLRGPTSGANADTILIPSGQTLDARNGSPSGTIVNYKCYTDGSLVNVSSTSWVTAYTYPVYTPIRTNSYVTHRWSILTRGYRNGGNDARGRIKITRNGSILIQDQEMGVYDYGGSGPWWRMTYTGGSDYNNVTGTDVSCVIEIATLGTDLEYNSNDGGSTTRSFYEIIETVQ